MFGNFSLFKTPFPGRNSVPPSFVSFFFVFYIFSYLLLKSWVAFLGAWCPLQAFRSCFVEFTGCLNALWWICGGKVFSPSYSSAILAPMQTYFKGINDLGSDEQGKFCLLNVFPRLCLHCDLPLYPFPFYAPFSTLHISSPPPPFPLLSSLSFSSPLLFLLC